MSDDEAPDVAQLLAAVRALRAVGRYEDYVHAARTLAREHPTSARVRVEAAYACDGFGSEHEAVAHYDAAMKLGVPPALRQGFLLGYGSTLRNVGRVDEALAVLTAAASEFREDRGLRCFLALALLSSGRGGDAVATLLDVVLALAEPERAPDVTAVDRALAHYRDALRALARERVEPPPL